MATEKGWTDFMRVIDSSLDTLEKADKEPETPRRSDKDIQDFFSRMSHLPTKRSMRKERMEGKPAGTTRTVKIVGKRKRIPEPAPPPKFKKP